MGKQNLYEILNVSNSAAQDEIHRAYLRSKSTYSNDNPSMYTMFSPAEASEILKMVEEAYSVLSNCEARKQYDHQIHKDSQTVTVDNSMETLNDLQDLSTNQSKVSVITSPDTASVLSRSDVLPDGYIRTKFGMYEVDAAFEEEIDRVQMYDGDFLKKIRLYKKIDLNQISEITKISSNYFISIESENYECLPAAVFVRGFLVQYSKALGLEPDKVAKSYLKKMKEA